MANDTSTQTTSDKSTEAAAAASGATSKATGGQQSTAVADSTLASLKGKLLGIFKRPS